MEIPDTSGCLRVVTILPSGWIVVHSVTLVTVAKESFYRFRDSDTLVSVAKESASRFRDSWVNDEEIISKQLLIIPIIHLTCNNLHSFILFIWQIINRNMFSG